MTFNIITLGCKVNTYESNVMHDALVNKGYIETNNDDADIYIINTCTVTNTSDNKSLKMVRQAIRKNPNAIIVVCGCMTQANPDLVKDLKEVSIVLGNKYKSNIVELIEEYMKTKERIVKVEDIMNAKFENMCLNNFKRTRAFVKIEDGCENYCSYCIIPYSRGKVRSKDPKIVIEEVTNLINNNHHEIVLTGIHTGHYGSDLENYDFADLLNELVKIDGLERLRISSIEITELNDKFLEVLKNNKVLVDHMHIPLQSGSDKVLKLMNRKYDKEYFINKINTIRNIRPEMSITTDLIVGFPGETKEDFEETIETLKIVNFSKIHVFPFSLRKGTKAEEMPNHLDETTKKERVKIVMELSKELEENYFKKYIGKKVEVIPEMYKDGYIIGHTGNYLLVKIPSNELNNHDKIEVTIEDVIYPYCIAK